jgi:hypothetical protein
VVPLEEVEPVLGDERVEPGEQVLRDLRVPDVEHLLVAPLPRAAPDRTEHPIRMGAGEVGVEVHHLRLDPEPDLHAELADDVEQRMESVGPHLLVDVPVPETGGVVAATTEPAIVEHESLDPDRRRGLGEAPQAIEVVIEVDGLPRVEHDRSRLPRMTRAGPHVAMDAGRRAVEPFVGPREQDPRCGVRLAGAEPDLAGA